VSRTCSDNTRSDKGKKHQHQQAHNQPGAPAEHQQGVAATHCHQAGALVIRRREAQIIGGDSFDAVM
jgi:hypothetical protein